MKFGLCLLLFLAFLGLGMSAPAFAGKKDARFSAERTGKKNHVKYGEHLRMGKAVKAKKSAHANKSLKRSRWAGSSTKNRFSARRTDAYIHSVAFDQQLENGKLALYSASAFVLDQASGEALVDKNSSAVLPIASISKLMTAMIVLDARQDMQEVITIGDDDVDTLKGTRSRLPVGTTMTRQTAMLLALMS